MKKLIAMALLLAAGPLQAAPPAEKIRQILEEGLEVRIVVIADTSGSMAASVRWGGPSKMSQARQALQEFVSALPAGIELGLLAFQNCDARWVVPLGPAGREDALARISGLQPSGRTPITASLEAAEQALLPSIKKNPYARNVILLVTDGLETCASVDAVKAAGDRISKAMLELNVIGFDLKGGGGYLESLGAQYYSAGDYEELRKGLATVQAELDVAK